MNKPKIKASLRFDEFRLVEKEDETIKSLIFSDVIEGLKVRLTISGDGTVINQIKDHLGVPVGRTVYMELNDLPPEQKRLPEGDDSGASD